MDADRECEANCGRNHTRVDSMSCKTGRERRQGISGRVIEHRVLAVVLEGKKSSGER